MLLGKFNKQPAEREAYAIEYEDDLAKGDTIAPAPLVEIVAQGAMPDTSAPVLFAVDVTATRVTLWIGGGTVRQTYKVTVTATTVAGRILQDEFILKIKDY
jgi:hypothetical protein